MLSVLGNLIGIFVKNILIIDILYYYKIIDLN